MDTTRRRPDALLLNAKEASAYTGLPVATLYEGAATGRIPSLRLGRAVWFPREQLERWIEERTREGKWDE